MILPSFLRGTFRPLGFLLLASALAACSSSSPSGSAQAENGGGNNTGTPLPPSQWMEASIADVHAHFQAHTLTCTRLVQG